MVMHNIVFCGEKCLAFVLKIKYPILCHNLVFPCLIKHTSNYKRTNDSYSVFIKLGFLHNFNLVNLSNGYNSYDSLICECTQY